MVIFVWYCTKIMAYFYLLNPWNWYQLHQTKGGLISDFFFFGSNLQKRCHITTLSTFHIHRSAQGCDLGLFLEIEAKVKNFLRLSHLYLCYRFCHLQLRNDLYLQSYKILMCFEQRVLIIFRQNLAILATVWGQKGFCWIEDAPY